MVPKIPRALWVAVPLGFLLYFFHLGATGLLGPDEPRYASVAREMARSGDWITPRLWGQPWFEKPALLYWMSGAAFRAGLGPDLAPRLPVAILAVAFLVFYWRVLEREFSCRAAWFATIILGTGVAWVGFSQVGVTDLPLAAPFSAAMLLAIPWVARGDARNLPAVAALLGFAVLAKSLVPLVLAAPLALGLVKGSLRDVLRVRVAAPFLLVAVPWYALCYARNGRVFFDTLFVQHQFGRFTSGALQHVEPWWFYLPVFAGLLMPWTPLAALRPRTLLADPGRRFLLAWVVFGLCFFSAAANKLPGYVLPLIPAAAALMGIALDEAGSAGARVSLAACALSLGVFVAAAGVLPDAVAVGLSRASLPAFHWTWLLPAAVAAAAWRLESRSRRLAALLLVGTGAVAGVLYLKTAATPELDRLASARPLWRQIAGRAGNVCAGDIRRDARYGLNYYSVTPLPDCADQPKPIQITQMPGAPPRLVLRSTGSIDPHSPRVVLSRFRD
jgi:4-amino-4-deoxy-L-arabinose transferase-like glycosyltransferase